MSAEKNSISRLLEALGSNDLKRITWACEELVAMGELALPPLLDAFTTGTPYLKMGILLAFGAMGLPARPAVPLLVSIVRDGPPDDVLHPDSGLCGAAAQTLGRIGDPAAVPCLIEALKYANYLCSSAAGALGQIRDTQAIEPLIGVLRDRNKFWVPRGAAAVALGQFGEAAREALPALEEALTYDCSSSGEKWDLRAREAVVDAIDRVTGRSAESRLKGHGYRYEMWGIK